MTTSDPPGSEGIWSIITFYGGIKDGAVELVATTRTLTDADVYRIHRNGRYHLYRLVPLPDDGFVLVVKPGYRGPLPDHFAEAHFEVTQVM